MSSLTQWTQHGRHTLANIFQEVHIRLGVYKRDS